MGKHRKRTRSSSSSDGGSSDGENRKRLKKLERFTENISEIMYARDRVPVRNAGMASDHVAIFRLPHSLQ
ncbi:unnamed protein product, partial [Callosobruchus maculatus]